MLPDEDIVELQENIMFCDNLTEAVVVQMIHSLGENGFHVNDEPFLKDMGFIIESVRASLYREMDIVHPMARVMEIFTKAQPMERDEETKTVNFRMNENAFDDILEVMEKIDNGKEEEPEPPKVS